MRQTMQAARKIIQSIDGVLSARLITDAAGDLQEIRILADRARSAGQLSSDIQLAVLMEVGIFVEMRNISIIPADPSSAKPDGCPVIKSFSVSSERNTFTASVALSLHGQSYRGAASGMNTRLSRYVTVATACINALHALVSGSAFCVADVTRKRMEGADTFHVAVFFFHREEEKLLTGSAPAGADEYRAVIRATLNAVNRVLPTLLYGSAPI